MVNLVCRLLLEKNFFNDTATTEIYTLSLHDALPILFAGFGGGRKSVMPGLAGVETIKHNHLLALTDEEIGRAHV